MPDPSVLGSVTVRLRDTDGNAVGGTLAIYRVAQAVSDGSGWHLEWLDAYSSMGDDISAMTGAISAAYSRQLASRLSAIVAAGGEGVSALEARAAGEDGAVTFTGLELGMYLVVQTQAAEGYSSIDPFVVTVPVEDPATGELAYDVEATPKSGPVSKEEPDNPPTPTPPTPGTPDEPLPKTGQPWTPMFALLAAGCVLLLAGAAVLQRRRRAS